MQVDLDNTPSPEWSLTVKFRGEVFATRRIVLRDVKAFQPLLAMNPPRPALLRKAVDSLLIEPKPDAASMRAESLVEIITAATLEYFRLTVTTCRTAADVRQFGAANPIARAAASATPTFLKR